MTATYKEKSIIILSDVMRNHKDLSKEQLKIISDCFKLLSEQETTQEIFLQIESMLTNIGFKYFALFEEQTTKDNNNYMNNIIKKYGRNK